MDFYQKSGFNFAVVIIASLSSLCSIAWFDDDVSLIVKSSAGKPNPITGNLGLLTCSSAISSNKSSLQNNDEVEVNFWGEWRCVIDCVSLGQRLLFLLCFGSKICDGWRWGMSLTPLFWLAWKHGSWSIGVDFLKLVWSGSWTTSLEWPSRLSYWWLLIQKSRYAYEIHCKIEFPAFKIFNYLPNKVSYLGSYYFTSQVLDVTQNLSLFVYSLISVLYNSFLSSMDKGKQKVHEQLFAEVVKAIPTENKNPTPSGDSKAPPLCGNPNKQKNKKQARKNQKHKYEKEAGEPSSGVSSINAASFFSKLSLVKENFQALEETTLLGFLVGKHVDFNKKVSKLKYDWKNINGEIDFYDRQMGWFEMRFSNPIDKLRVWEGRPYHLFSQLLLLKPWCSSFNPTTEPIFMVDMWVRIPFLPPEYYNFEAISTILEFNNIGRLIKLDPNANKRNWAKFARFCINLDCSELVNTEILIPNEVGELKKYRLWFEDIPKGCGNYGGFDHEFYNCPLRRFIPPKFQIKFKKQAGEESGTNKKQDGWEEVKGRFKKKQISASERASPKALQKEENYGGIAVVYITDGSSVESKESPITSSKLSKCSSGNTIEISTKNEEIPPNNVDVNGPYFEEVLNQNNKDDKTEAAINLPLTESNLEGASALANNLATIPILSDLGINVVTPPGEENSKFKD